MTVAMMTRVKRRAEKMDSIKYKKMEQMTQNKEQRGRKERKRRNQLMEMTELFLKVQQTEMAYRYLKLVFWPHELLYDHK